MIKSFKVDKGSSIVLFAALILAGQFGCAARDVDLGDASDVQGNDPSGGASTSAGGDPSGGGGEKPVESAGANAGTTGGGSPSAGTNAGGAPGAGTAGTGGSSPPDRDCSSVETALAEKLADLQACETDEDCGASVSTGTCGCTRATPIHNGATDSSTAEYSDLVRKLSSCKMQGGGSCDCPAADGFVCRDNKCAWNYLE
jgi:hypothetical protein